MARRTRRTHPVRAAAAQLPPTQDSIPCSLCGTSMPRERRDVAGIPTCPPCTEHPSFVEDVDASKATGYEIRLAPTGQPTAPPAAPSRARAARRTTGRTRPEQPTERPLQRNSSLEDALGLHARKGPSTSKVWGRRAAPVEDDESELAREMRSNRRDRW